MSKYYFTHINMTPLRRYNKLSARKPARQKRVLASRGKGFASAMKKIGRFLLPVAKNVLKRSTPVLKKAVGQTAKKTARQLGAAVLDPERSLKSEISTIAKASGKLFSRNF